MLENFSILVDVMQLYPRPGSNSWTIWKCTVKINEYIYIHTFTGPGRNKVRGKLSPMVLSANNTNSFGSRKKYRKNWDFVP